MSEGLYIAASGGNKQLKKLDFISNNISNAGTNGFKRDMLIYNERSAPFHRGGGGETQFNKITNMSEMDSVVSYVQTIGSQTDFAQGSIIHSENPFDLALEGEGFFVIDTPNGDRYTRNGSFNMDPLGQLVDSNGNMVVNDTQAKNKRGNENEPIFIPTESKQITVDQEGLVYGEIDNQLVILGQIKIVTFANKDNLIKEGRGLYKNGNPKIKPAEADTVKILQGYKETSNVNAIHEMTQMIETVRTLEAYQKIIQSIDEADDQSVNSLAQVA